MTRGSWQITLAFASEGAKSPGPMPVSQHRAKTKAARTDRTRARGCFLQLTNGVGYPYHEDSFRTAVSLSSEPWHFGSLGLRSVGPIVRADIQITYANQKLAPAGSANCSKRGAGKLSPLLVPTMKDQTPLSPKSSRKLFAQQDLRLRTIHRIIFEVAAFRSFSSKMFEEVTPCHSSFCRF